MLTMYPACFFKEEGGYSVVFPDLENGYLSTCGEDLEEAMAIDCLAGYIHLSWELNDEIPPASSLGEIDLKEVAREAYDSEDDYQEAFVNMISVDVKAYAKEHFEKSVKKTLTIPAWLNDLALEKNINFSQVLQEALLTKFVHKIYYNTPQTMLISLSVGLFCKKLFILFSFCKFHCTNF